MKKTRDDTRRILYARHKAAGKTGPEAARLAGYIGNPKKTCERLNKDPLVLAELDKARESIREATKYDALAAMKEFDEAIAFAQRTGNATAYVRAVELRAKLHGLMVEKVDQRVQSGFCIQIGGIDTPGEKLVQGEVVDAPQITNNGEQ